MFSSSYLHNMKSLSYLIHGVFCGRCGWRCECEILLALEQLGKDPLEMRSNLWSMLGILSLTWYISAKEEIEDESWLIWEEDSQLSLFFVLNSKFCTFNEGVQKTIFTQVSGWIQAIFQSDGQAEIIILEGVEMNHHDIKHSSTGSRWFQRILEEKSTLS